MLFVHPSVAIIPHSADCGETVKVIERAYRICYKSEDRMGEGSTGLIHKLLHTDLPTGKMHLSPLEHRRIGVYADNDLAMFMHNWSLSRLGGPFTYTFSNSNGSIIEGNFRTFFEFVREASHSPIRNVKQAAVSLSNKLHTYYPVIFDELENVPGMPQNDVALCNSLEDDYATFHIVTTRDILQELVRHRSMSFSVESTRYCNYSKKGMTFCYPDPYKWSEYLDGIAEASKNGTTIVNANSMALYFYHMIEQSEKCYEHAIKSGVKPQEARMLLPGGLKTELLMTGTTKAWEHFLELRNTKEAHPQMRLIAEQISEQLKKL